VLIEVQRGQCAGEWPMRGRRRGPARPVPAGHRQPPGAQEPGSSGRAGALEAALRDYLGLPPVS